MLAAISAKLKIAMLISSSQRFLRGAGGLLLVGLNRANRVRNERRLLGLRPLRRFDQTVSLMAFAVAIERGRNLRHVARDLRRTIGRANVRQASCPRAARRQLMRIGL